MNNTSKTLVQKTVESGHDLIAVLDTSPSAAALGATGVILVVVPGTLFRHYSNKDPDTWGEEQFINDRIECFRLALVLGIFAFVAQCISTAGVINTLSNSVSILFAIGWLKYVVSGLRT